LAIAIEHHVCRISAQGNRFMSAEHRDRNRRPHELKAHVERLPASATSDAELRDALEELSQTFAFAGLTWL